MQPIPLTPAPVDISSTVTLTVVLFSLGVLFALASLVAFLVRGKDSMLLPIGGGLAFLLAFGGVLGLSNQSFEKKSGEIQATIDATKAQHAAVQSTVQDDYGLKLNTEEAAALEYPEKTPKEDFKIYGQLQKIGKGSRLSLPSDSVYLIWKDDSLQLAQGSGQDFTELKLKN